MRPTKSYLLINFLLFLSIFSFAEPAPKEGMWIPYLLDQLNFKEMQSMGFQLSPEDIYSVNHASIKDAIVNFGGFCTASIISNQGLLLTNHHCGYGSIQKHSSIENDYLTNGFWTNDFSEELPNPGLSVTFIVEIRDVTKSILSALNGRESETERTQKINARIQSVISDLAIEEGYDIRIYAYYSGNEYYMFITQTFRDIRLVGAPPSAIGKFGGDTDNWMWPRHNADFSLFRIYANADNQPADYSPDNIPFIPKYHLSVATDGVLKNDFTMVFGFPGRTNEYMSSEGLDMVVNQTDPIAVKLRTFRLDVMEEDMRTDDKVRIQYASKQSGISNGWKKWQGEMMGIKRTKGLERKREEEEQFQEWAQQNAVDYIHLPDDFHTAYNNYKPLSEATEYINEGIFGVELMRFVTRARNMIDMANSQNFHQETFDELLYKFQKQSIHFFKDYNRPTDQRIFPLLFSAFYTDVPTVMQPALMQTIGKKFKGDFARYGRYIFEQSVFADSSKLNPLLRSGKVKKIAKLEKDPAYFLTQLFIDFYTQNIKAEYIKSKARIDSLQRIYIAALHMMPHNRPMYADANGTMRIAYGKVEPMYPKDGVYYKYYTTLDGVMEKAATGKADYKIPDKLRQLWKDKDYGQWGDRDGMHVCFIASNHTTGGNSGSPVLNNKGQLVGLNFDRNWEGTMSDLNYDIRLCRNISVDIRYILFIIDKYANQQHLIDELTLVKGQADDESYDTGKVIPSEDSIMNSVIDISPE